MRDLSLLATSLLSVATLSYAHPHKRTSAEVTALKHATRSLNQCSSSLTKRGHNAAGIERRRAKAEQIRKERGLKSDKRYIRRDLDTILGTSHKSDLTGFTQYVSPSYLFGLNSSCALEAGDVTEGPYFVAGEYFRSNLREDQEGVPIWLDIEVVDVSTCEPVTGNYVEIWATNATGVYAGVAASGNGDGGDANLDTTHGRGIQKTSEDGAVQFETLFPGHYTGRTQHIHVAVLSSNGTEVLPNGTVYQNVATHVGQMFFDTDLAEQVEATAPYSTNTMTVTSNSEDSILEQQASTIDPVLEYVLLGDDVSDGLLMWTRLGVDLTNSVTMNIAAYHYADGGVANSNSNAMSGGSGGGQGGNGTMGGAPGGNSTSGGGAPPSGSGGMSGGSPPASRSGGATGAAVGGYGNSLSMPTGIASSSTSGAAQPAYTCLCSS